MNFEIYRKLKTLKPSLRLDVLKTLTPREESVIKKYYGVTKDGRLLYATTGFRRSKWTLKMLADYFLVTEVRISQIIDKAERKLLHPRRAEFWNHNI